MLGARIGLSSEKCRRQDRRIRTGRSFTVGDPGWDEDHTYSDVAGIDSPCSKSKSVDIKMDEDMANAIAMSTICSSTPSNRYDTHSLFEMGGR